ncbi:MAG: Pyruvate, phosphate dikinase [bacterium]|nr:Pyruvate, phosphate dikinase [bacterium]
MPAKYVYSFGGGKADGDESMKNLLGGKGANLAEMSGIGIPVPPGFTVTTEVCTHYYKHGRRYPKELEGQVRSALERVEKIMGRKFGDPRRPLLVSVRSGARLSMPGMMETVLNVGLTETTLPGLIEESGDARFVYDSYRRLIMMYSDVVMEKAAGVEPKDGHGIRPRLEHLIDERKHAKGVTLDTDLSAEDWRELAARFKETVLEVLGKPFPDDPMEQLWGGIGAVFASWMGRRAVEYRRIEKIPEEWGTAVNVQAMVFGNMGEDCCTGVAFTRNPATGENHFYGEFLTNAQGEDVVAGTRTPSPINDESKNDANSTQKTLAEVTPSAYEQLNSIRLKLEKHYKDMQDIEFTVERGTLWMLQTRTGKRTGAAAARMAVEMAQEGLIDRKIALMRVKPEQLLELLLPMLDPKVERATHPVAKGLPAGPGGAVGEIVFTADEAAELAKSGRKVLLVRNETSPEDVHGMHVAQGILTSKGGMTSHAALVARGWGKCCIVGCSALRIDMGSRTLTIGDKTYRQGDVFSLNGTSGRVFDHDIALVEPDLEHNEHYMKLMEWSDSFRKIGIRTNADTPEDAARALKFGAQGIGLFRIEHMFYGEGSDDALFLLRKMIMSATLAERTEALDELFPHMKDDIKKTLAVMGGYPVTIRLLDPPLHEFVPKSRERLEELAASLHIDLAALERRAEGLHENNPMMGHRGVRLGVTYPEVTAMQVRAILEAAGELLKVGVKALPEIMIPVTCTSKELDHQKAIVERVHSEACAKLGLSKIPYLYGTMIEIPRAALTSNRMAEVAEFFSFGTNDLTQMSFGFSRDDIGGFLGDYLEKKLLPEDPFASIDIEAVGELIKISIERGRATRPDLKVGICGEHGGDPASVRFCHEAGLNYVSCSPFRVPIARFAAAQAAITSTPKTQAKPAPRKAAPKKAAVKAKRTAKPAPVKKAAKRVAAPRAKAAKKVAPKRKAVLKKAPKRASAKKATKKTAKRR